MTKTTRSRVSPVSRKCVNLVLAIETVSRLAEDMIDDMDVHRDSGLYEDLLHYSWQLSRDMELFRGHLSRGGLALLDQEPCRLDG